MIELTPLARPYAKALFSSAIESNTLEDIAVELNTMAAASLEDGVINTIENPTLSRQEIVDILVKLFDGSISETSKKLLSILAENKRLNLLEPIFSIYQDLLEQHDSTKEHIEEKIKATYGNDANISFSKDPNIMGGLSIKIGDETLDLSIRGKINKLVNQLNF
jgi:F-type H+-transporting ATPase subunit delta